VLKDKHKIKNVSRKKHEPAASSVAEISNIAVQLPKRPDKIKKETIPRKGVATMSITPIDIDVELLASALEAPIKTFKAVDKPKRIIRRKPGVKNPANYFTLKTQDSIVKYQNEKDPKKKEQIYVKEVLPAFDSLVENLINVYGFKISYETKKDLKIECLEFLYSTVNKFDVSKGSKAFSYFNVVAKNWLTIKSKQNSKRTKTYVSSDDRDSLSSNDLEQYEQYNVVPSYEDMIQKAEMAKYLKTLVEELEKKVKTENEKVTVMAINTIIQNLDNIDILNKRAVLLYIREITGLSSKQLSLVLASIKKHYKEIKKQ
jgi:hypothetical protein